MRTIKGLMSKYDDVWFHIDDEVKRQFVDECNTSGYAFNSDRSALMIKNCGSRMALDAQTKTIAYVAGMIWFNSFNNPAGLIRVRDSVRGSVGVGLRVNYQSFLNGEPCYVYKELGVLVASD